MILRSLLAAAGVAAATVVASEGLPPTVSLILVGLVGVTASLRAIPLLRRSASAAAWIAAAVTLGMSSSTTLEPRQAAGLVVACMAVIAGLHTTPRASPPPAWRAMVALLVTAGAAVLVLWAWGATIAQGPVASLDPATAVGAAWRIALVAVAVFAAGSLLPIVLPLLRRRRSEEDQAARNQETDPSPRLQAPLP